MPLHELTVVTASLEDAYLALAGTRTGGTPE